MIDRVRTGARFHPYSPASEIGLEKGEVGLGRVGKNEVRLGLGLG